MYQININLQFCLSNICQWKLFSNELFVSRKGNFIIWQVHLFWHSCRRIHCFLFYWNTVDTHTILCYRSSLAVQWLGLHAVLPTACVQCLTGELRSYKSTQIHICVCVCISSVQFSHSVVSSILGLHGLQHARLACPSPTPRAFSNSRLSNSCHPTISSSVVQPCHLLLSPSPPAFNLSHHQGLFQWVLCIRWPKHWPQLQHQFSNEYSGNPMISFRIDWFDLQGTLKSLLQHYSSKASILWHSIFSIAQLSHPYVTTGKTIVLTRWTFLGKLITAF